ncbi:phosphatases II [Amylocystis lapponica]|nr:phosphatases II [Amylocystis lapponica]
MTDFVRRLVSGNKARYKDGELDLDLDLVYITDQVIVMGYPAAGIEGLYRNRREDAKRFLEHRHGKNFWVFNFCPVGENSYPASIFDGRVSRYPFPDHHAPPLAILALVAREMRTWISGSPDRVAVLHCKAGKGRSGTLACSYLLALSTPLSTQQQGNQQTAIAWTMTHAEEVMNAMPPDEAHDDGAGTGTSTPEGDLIKQELAVNREAEEPPQANTDGTDAGATLSEVLALHTARRMRPPNSTAAKEKQGVSIPSQRRWLYYWSLLLARQAPPGFWPSHPQDAPASKVRLTQVRLRMQELSGTTTTLVRAANAIIDRAMPAKTRAGASARSRSQIWATLARYDDELVELLETWELRTRGEGDDMGRRRSGAERAEAEALAGIFVDGKWDREKMVRGFARLAVTGEDAVHKEESQNGKLVAQLLRPSTGDIRGIGRDQIEQGRKTAPTVQNAPGVNSEEASVYDGAQTPNGDSGVVLDANREVRIKLFMGQVFMGWFWFIPTFHMPHPRVAGQAASLLLRRKEIDFPLGIGSNIIDVEVSMEWCSEESPKAETDEPGGLAATLQAAAAGDLTEVVETKQAAED